MHNRLTAARLAGCFAAVGLLSLGHAVRASEIRVAAYNIEADIDGVTTPRPGLYQVLEGIGEENIGGDVQPLDILGLEETTSNAATIAPIVSNLNSYYGGTAVYAQSPVQGTESGGDPSDGNGPNALIYNTSTLTLLASVGVGTPEGSTNGEYRQVMRYEFEPVGGNAADIFYVYVTHMKSSSSGSLFTDETDRAEEAAIIRANEATLVTASNPNPSVLYMGDFNLSGSALVTSGSQSVSAYQTMTAPGPGQAVDPANTNPQNNNETWDDNSTYAALWTETDTKLQYRDDLQLMTQNVYNGTTPGLAYVQGSLHPFGNNGSVGLDGNVSSSSNTALNDLEPDAPISASTILSDETTASDHVPIVADYTFVVPEPSSIVAFAIGSAALLLVIIRRRGAQQAIING
jgi:endonuclease/exonuclease/phosphatase family metal-dependent hydrolase